MNISLTCPACDEDFDVVQYENGGRESPSGWLVDWNDLPDVCPACGHTWTSEEVQAFETQAVDHVQSGLDDYQGPTEPEDLER